MHKIILPKRQIARNDIWYYLVEMKGIHTHGTIEFVAFSNITLNMKMFVNSLENKQIFYASGVHLETEKTEIKSTGSVEYIVSLKAYFAIPLFVKAEEFVHILEDIGKEYHLEIGHAELFERPHYIQEPTAPVSTKAEEQFLNRDQERAEALLEHVTLVYQTEQLQKQIDRALDERDKETFTRLSETYASLKQKGAILEYKGHMKQ